PPPRSLRRHPLPPQAPSSAATVGHHEPEPGVVGQAGIDGRIILLALLTCLGMVLLTPPAHAARLAVEALLVIAALAAVRTPPIWLLKRALLLLPFVLLAIAPAAFAGLRGHDSTSPPVGLALARVGICFGALAAAARAAE